jgi:hypothetical protein
MLYVGTGDERLNAVLVTAADTHPSVADNLPRVQQARVERFDEREVKGELAVKEGSLRHVKSDKPARAQSAQRGVDLLRIQAKLGSDRVGIDARLPT